MSSNRSKGVFLDIDPTIVEKNLRITGDPEEEFLTKIGDTIRGPSKLVKPFPGFCVKTRLVGSGIKVFVNICHTDAIPAPKDISEQELFEILNSDEATNFKVPMSIGEVREDVDKQGQQARVCDVAINPSFFKKIQDLELFRNFFLTVVFEGVKDKHDLFCTDDKIILKNRKVFGSLQMHRIQQREVEEKMRGESMSLMEEIQGDRSNARKPLIETISSTENEVRVPEYQLFIRKDEPKNLIGEFKFPDVAHCGELILDLGEDRIVIESTSRNYLLDIFIPRTIRPDNSIAVFNQADKILTITMPLKGG